MKSEEQMASKSEKKGMALAMTHASSVSAASKPIQVAQPMGVLMKRIIEFLNTRPWIYLETTTVLMLPEMKMTGIARPKATLETTGPADSRAGELTLGPTNA